MSESVLTSVCICVLLMRMGVLIIQHVHVIWKIYACEYCLPTELDPERETWEADLLLPQLLWICKAPD